MKYIKQSLCSPRIRISVLLSVSVLAMLFCSLNLPIVYVGLIELFALAGCIAFFRKVDVTQYELFQYKPHWFWRICEWYWTIWFCFNTLPFIQWLGNCYPTLKYAYFVYPSVFKPITDFVISNFGKVIAVRYLSTIMLAPVIILIMPIVYYCFRWLFKQIAEFFQSFTKFEKYFLAISSTVLIAILIIVSSKTSYFVYPVDRELYLTENTQNIVFNFKKYEEKYAFDYIFYGDCFFNVDTAELLSFHYYENDCDYCRHPFSHIVLLFFTPLFNSIGTIFSIFFSSYVYCIALSIAVVQIVLYILSGLLLARLFSPLSNHLFSRIILTVFISSYPVIFSFCPERLIFSEYFLVLAIYTCLMNNSIMNSILVQLGAIGLTSLSLFPIAMINLLNKKNMSNFFIIFILLFVSIYKNYDWLNVNSAFIEDKVSIASRLKSYFQFESSCFSLPKYDFVKKDIDISISKSRINTIRLMPERVMVVSVPSNVNSLLGLLIFSLCCLSTIKLIKYRIIMISALWILISFGIIGVIGFGNSECVLYCSYFSWAIIPLALLPFYWLWQKYPRLPIPQALYLFAAYLAISNLYFIYQVVQVVSERYIVPPGM